MLEIDEDILPVALAFQDCVGPSLNVALVIASVPESEVAVAGGRLYGRCQVLTVGDAEGRVVLAERVEQIIAMP
jgi:hypothetical protein